jgi:16S rRNA (cytosine967-C5)-methyltransferase
MRARALSVLEAVDGGGVFADQLLRPSDAPFVRELVNGVLRRRLTLDSIHDAYGKRKAADLDAPVRAALRAGLYQFIFMDGVPPHAIAGETVGALRLKSHRSYVNAVLRRILRECKRVDPGLDRGGAHPSKRFERPGRAVCFFTKKVFPDPEQDRLGYLAASLSHPPLLVERWVAQVGEEQAVARMEEGNEVPVLVLRPRIGRVDAVGLVARLADEQLVSAVVEREHGEDAVRVPKPRGLLDGRSYRKGLFSVQDPRQMDAVEILDPKAGEVIWDACAAPGGKTLQISEALGGQGGVVATDRSAERLTRLDESLERLGLHEGVEVAAYDLLQDDGPPPPGKPERGFDAILLDAPCSNSAVLGRRPEARWRLQPDTFREMAALQTRLLESARQHLAPGGRLVLSSCSYEPEEGPDHGLLPTRSPFVWFVKAES